MNRCRYHLIHTLLPPVASLVNLCNELSCFRSHLSFTLTVNVWFSFLILLHLGYIKTKTKTLDWINWPLQFNTLLNLGIMALFIHGTYHIFCIFGRLNSLKLKRWHCNCSGIETINSAGDFLSIIALTLFINDNLGH